MIGKPTIIDGKAAAERRLRALAKHIKRSGRRPGLGIIVATKDPATAQYVAAKQRQGETVGFAVDVRGLDPGSSLDEIVAACENFNADDSIDGYIVQLPLPEGVDTDRALAAVSPEKDADGLTPENLDALYTGRPKMIPATPKGILTLLDEYRIPVRGRNATVVGQGRLTGRPLAALLEQRGARVTRATRAVSDLAAATRTADLLVAAAGRRELITADMVKEGAAVIDVGISRVDGKIVGDVDYEPAARKAAAITPVPGGVGPMTVVSLLENVAKLAAQNGKSNGQNTG